MRIHLGVGLATLFMAPSLGCGDQASQQEMNLSAGATELVTSFTFDQCRDILKEGVFQQSTFRENAFFQQIIYSRFLSSTYEQSKTDNAFGFGVPVGEMVLGGNYSEQAYKEKKADIQRVFSNNTTAVREVDVALSTGDERVVSAWSNCMRTKGGGLSLRFEAVSPTEVVATLEWFPTAGITETVIDEPLVLPEGARITSGPRCVRTGKRLVASKPCYTTIRLPSATTTIVATIGSRNGSARAFLPPRIMLKRDVQRYVFTKADSLVTFAKKQTLYPQHEVALSKKEIDEGWRFDPASWRITLDNSLSCGTNGSKDLQSEVTLYTVSYRFTVWAASTGPYRDCVGAGRVHPSIMLVRERWVPMNTVPLGERE